MEILDDLEAISRLCSAYNKPGMYFSINSVKDEDDSSYFIKEAKKAAPWLDTSEISCSVILQGGGFLLFDSEEERDDVFDRTVGDDGPTSKNSYSEDKVRVYALTVSRDGKFRNENT